MIITKETKNYRGLELLYNKKSLDRFILYETIMKKRSDSIILAPKEIEKLHKEFGKILNLIQDKERMEGEV
jgi:hypothetical protein